MPGFNTISISKITTMCQHLGLDGHGLHTPVITDQYFLDFGLHDIALYPCDNEPALHGVEINIAWDDAYQIRFDLGERGGKRIVDTNLTSYLYT